MIIACPRCGILYGVEPAALAAEERRVRCSNCDWEWLHTNAAALPDHDEALRLFALSMGRAGPQHPSSAAQAPAAPDTDTAGTRHTADADRSPQQQPQRVTSAAAGESEAAPDADEAIGQRLPSSIASEEDAQSGVDDADEVHHHDAGERALQAASGESASPDHEDEPHWREMGVEPARVLYQGEVVNEAFIPEAPAGETTEEQMPLRPSASRRPRTAVVAVGTVAATLLVAVGLLAASRGPVIAAFPGAAGFYRAVGLSAANDFAEGLEIRDVSSSRSWSDDGQVLTVAGDLANVAGQPRILPMVRVVLVDGSDAEVQEVVVLPPGESLPVGETVRFEARIDNPAETAERIKVSLAPRPKPS
jgi:predicted Zn finger-like uncharacterized protein